MDTGNIGTTESCEQEGVPYVSQTLGGDELSKVSQNGSTRPVKKKKVPWTGTSEPGVGLESASPLLPAGEGHTMEMEACENVKDDEEDEEVSVTVGAGGCISGAGKDDKKHGSVVEGHPDCTGLNAGARINESLELSHDFQPPSYGGDIAHPDVEDSSKLIHVLPKVGDTIKNPQTLEGNDPTEKPSNGNTFGSAIAPVDTKSALGRQVEDATKAHANCGSDRDIKSGNHQDSDTYTVDVGLNMDSYSPSSASVNPKSNDGADHRLSQESKDADQRVSDAPVEIMRANGCISQTATHFQNHSHEPSDITRQASHDNVDTSNLSSYDGDTSSVISDVVSTTENSSTTGNHRRSNTYGSSFGNSSTDFNAVESSTENPDTESSSSGTTCSSSTTESRGDVANSEKAGRDSPVKCAGDQCWEEPLNGRTPEESHVENVHLSDSLPTQGIVVADLADNESHCGSEHAKSITETLACETTTEIDSENNAAKMVTFAEDKEVFDMGYVVPASITVHLDTPVSAIAHGDVVEIPQPPADPTANDASAYPITGILKTDDDGRDGIVPESVQPDLAESSNRTDGLHRGFDGKFGQENDGENAANHETSTHVLNPSEIVLDVASDALGKAGDLNEPGVNDPSVAALLLNGHHLASHSPGLEPPYSCKTTGSHIEGDREADNLKHESEQTEGGLGTVTPDAFKLTSVAASVGENAVEDSGHREFIVESVAEEELLLAGGVESTNVAGSSAVDPGSEVNGKAVANGTKPVGHGDGGSHSTDSNCQDTIGPLDNPQFLKTLNYTASQAFDQDDHFGFHSGAPDARSLAGLQDPDDLDGGWAWVVLVAAFIGATLLGASVYAAGVLMNAILLELEDDLTKASWVGSVFVCVMSLSGPFVGSVLTRFGARCTVSCAGLVLTLGFIGASQASTIEQLILTHGVVSGLGAGFTINPLFVVVGQYFNKYRGFACGIVAMGAGAGMLSGGSFMTYLLEKFDLSGTYLIWAGLMLHVTPCGLLLLPSPEERVRKVEKDLGIGDLKVGPDGVSVNSGANSLFGSVNQSMMSGIDGISASTNGRRLPVSSSIVSRRPSKLVMAGNEADVPLLRAAVHNEMSRSSHCVNRPAPGFTKSSLNKSSSDICGPLSPMVGGGPVGGGHGPPQTPIFEGHELYTNNVTPGSSVQNYHLSSSSILSPSSNTLNTGANPLSSPSGGFPPPPYFRHQYGPYRPSSQPHLLLGGLQSQYTSTSHISGKFSLRSGVASSAPRGEYDNESITSAFVSHLRPRDSVSPRHPLGSRSISTLVGSIASFPTSLAIVKDDLRRFEPPGPHDGSLKGYIMGLLDSMRIIRNRPFCMFVLTGFFWALGESPVLIHLPSYVVSLGTSRMQASSLYTSMGIASMAGRFLSGLIASDVNIGPVLLYTGSMGVAGVVVCLSPLITATYTQQVIFSFLVGLYTGALVPLTSLITIELLGLGELSLGFGLISMAQGFGYLIGPPLSSLVVNSIGFVNAFVCSGIVLLTGSMLALSMTIFLLSREGEDEMDLDGGKGEGAGENTLGDLERALQKLADDSGSSEDLDHEGQSVIDLDDEVGSQVDDACENYNRILASEKSSNMALSHVDSKCDHNSVGEGKNSGKSLDALSSVVDSKENGGVVVKVVEDNVLMTEGDTPGVLAGETEGVDGRREITVRSGNNGDQSYCGEEQGLQQGVLPSSRVGDDLCGQDRLDTIIEVVGK